MRSRRDEAPQPLSGRDVTELLQSAVTMARENQRQDRTATLLAILVAVLAGTPVFLTRHANLGGAYFFGAVAAMAAVGAYLYLRNREDRASRRIYGYFLLAGTGPTLALLLTMGVPAQVLLGSLCRALPPPGPLRPALRPGIPLLRKKAFSMRDFPEKHPALAEAGDTLLSLPGPFALAAIALAPGDAPLTQSGTPRRPFGRRGVLSSRLRGRMLSRCTGYRARTTCPAWRSCWR